MKNQKGQGLVILAVAKLNSLILSPWGYFDQTTAEITAELRAARLLVGLKEKGSAWFSQQIMSWCISEVRQR